LSCSTAASRSTARSIVRMTFISLGYQSMTEWSSASYSSRFFHS